jgi:hypothetical protein
MNQFVQRLANWLANEVIVKGLAESRTFQRMALKTHTTVEDVKQKSTQQMESTLEELAKVTAENGASGSAAKGPPQPPLRGVPGFFVAFAKEVRKDIMGTK